MNRPKRPLKGPKRATKSSRSTGVRVLNATTTIVGNHMNKVNTAEADALVESSRGTPLHADLQPSFDAWEDEGGTVKAGKAVGGDEMEGTGMGIAGDDDSLTNNGVVSSASVPGGIGNGELCMLLGKTDPLVALQCQGDLFARKIELERCRGRTLDKSLGDIRHALSEQRKRMAALSRAATDRGSLTKQSITMENRLEKNKVKFNNCLARNRELRKDIDDHRHARVRCEGISDQLLGELADGKKQMSSIIRELQAANDEIERLQAKTANVGVTVRKAEADHKEELDRLQVMIEGNRKDILGAHVTGLAGGGGDGTEGGLLEDDLATGCDDVDDGNSGLDSPTGTPQHGSPALASVESPDSGDDSVDQPLLGASAASLKTLFDGLKEETGLDDVDLLLEQFVALDSKNFSLFNYVTEVCLDVDTLENQLEQLQRDVGRFANHSETNEEPRHAIVQELKKKHVQIERLGDRYARTETNLEAEFLRTKASVVHLFKRIRCHTTPEGEAFVSSLAFPDRQGLGTRYDSSRSAMAEGEYSSGPSSSELASSSTKATAAGAEGRVSGQSGGDGEVIGLGPDRRGELGAPSDSPSGTVASSAQDNTLYDDQNVDASDVDVVAPAATTAGESGDTAVGQEGNATSSPRRSLGEIPDGPGSSKHSSPTSTAAARNSVTSTVTSPGTDDGTTRSSRLGSSKGNTGSRSTRVSMVRAPPISPISPENSPGRKAGRRATSRKSMIRKSPHTPKGAPGKQHRARSSMVAQGSSRAAFDEFDESLDLDGTGQPNSAAKPRGHAATPPLDQSWVSDNNIRQLMGLIEQRASAIFSVFVASSSSFPAKLMAEAATLVNVQALKASNGPSHAHRVMDIHTLGVEAPSWSDNEDSDLGDEIEEEDGEVRARPLSRSELVVRACDKVARAEAARRGQLALQREQERIAAAATAAATAAAAAASSESAASSDATTTEDPSAKLPGRGKTSGSEGRGASSRARGASYAGRGRNKR